MFGKLNEARKMAEAIKEKLDQVSVMGQSTDGRVRVICNGNRRVTEVLIDTEISDKNHLAGLVKEATNEALEKAEKMSEEEMRNAASSLMPGGLGALGNLFGK